MKFSWCSENFINAANTACLMIKYNPNRIMENFVTKKGRLK